MDINFITIVISAIFFLVGIVLVISSIIIKINNDRKKKYYIYNTAEIVDYKVEKSSRTTCYAPIYKYSANGQDYFKTSDVATSWKPQIGEVVDIFCNPDDFNDIVLDKDIAWIILLIIGIAFSIAWGSMIPIFILTPAG